MLLPKFTDHMTQQKKNYQNKNLTHLILPEILQSLLNDLSKAEGNRNTTVIVSSNIELNAKALQRSTIMPYYFTIAPHLRSVKFDGILPYLPNSLKPKFKQPSENSDLKKKSVMHFSLIVNMVYNHQVLHSPTGEFMFTQFLRQI